MQLTVTHVLSLSAFALFAASTQAGVVGIGKQSDVGLIGDLPKEAASLALQEGKGYVANQVQGVSALQDKIASAQATAENLQQHLTVTNLGKRDDANAANSLASQLEGVTKLFGTSISKREVTSSKDDGSAVNSLTSQLEGVTKVFGTSVSKRQEPSTEGDASSNFVSKLFSTPQTKTTATHETPKTLEHKASKESPKKEDHKEAKGASKKTKEKDAKATSKKTEKKNDKKDTKKADKKTVEKASKKVQKKPIHHRAAPSTSPLKAMTDEVLSDAANSIFTSKTYNNVQQRGEDQKSKAADPLKEAAYLLTHTDVVTARQFDPVADSEYAAKFVNDIVEGVVKFDARNTVVPGLEILPGQGPAANKFINDLKTEFSKGLVGAYEAQPIIRSTDFKEHGKMRRQKRDLAQ